VALPSAVASGSGLNEEAFMLTDIQILLLLGLAAAAIVAAMPLFKLPAARRVLAGVGGSGLMALGATAFGLIAGGVIPVPSLAAQALAQEPSSASGSGSADAAAAPAATPSSSSTDPAIVDVTKFVRPSDRPAWIDEPQKLDGDVHTIPVASAPQVLEADARRALDRALEAATGEYIDLQLGSRLAPQLLRYDARDIKRRFVKKVHTDKAAYAAAEMYESFGLLEFDQSFRNELTQRWDGVRNTSRLTQLGLFAGAALLLLASVFGYFRLDNATRGYYTGRLQFLTAAAILAVIGAGVFAAQWIHWL
jgi:hypothetical protein